MPQAATKANEAGTTLLMRALVRLGQPLSTKTSGKVAHVLEQTLLSVKQRTHQLFLKCLRWVILLYECYRVSGAGFIRFKTAYTQ